MPRQLIISKTPAGLTLVGTEIRPIDPDDEVDCHPVILAYCPDSDHFHIAQMDPQGAPPDVVMLTREMVEQLVNVILDDDLVVPAGLKQAH